MKKKIKDNLYNYSWLKIHTKNGAKETKLLLLPSVVTVLQSLKDAVYTNLMSQKYLSK